MSLDEEYDTYVKNHITDFEVVDIKSKIKNVARKYIKLKIGQPNSNKKSYYLVYNESANACEAVLVYCCSEEEAIIIASVDENGSPNNLYATKVDKLTINTMNKYFL